MEPTLPELLLSGIKLMLIGMSIVYLFLALLVWVIGIAARLLDQYAGGAEPSPTLPAPAAGTEPDDAELVAVIGAALHRYQNR